jgi:hypothetical protein
MQRMLVTGLVAAAMGLVATPAMASITVNPGNTVNITSNTAVGDAFTITFNGLTNNQVVAGLGSTLQLSFAGISGNAYLFDYVLTNTSVSPATGSAVTVFGFNVDPNAVLAGSTVNGTFGIVSTGQITNQSLEICFKNGQNNNCNNSPGNTGVNVGTPGSGQLSMDFGAALPSSITLSNFIDRYQSVYAPYGSAIGTPTNITAVPEPATWAMMLVGFAGIGFTMRRRRQGKALMQIA